MKKILTSLGLALLTLIISSSQVLATSIVYVLGAASGSDGTSPGTISKIDVANSLSLATTGFSFASGGVQTVAVTPDQTKILVSDRFANLVYVIDTATNTLTSIPVSNDGEIVIAPNGQKAYIPGHCTDGKIFVLDLTTNTQSASISADSCGFFLAISPDGSKLYSPAIVNPSSYGLNVINTTTNTISNTIAFNESNTTIGKVVATATKIYTADAGFCCPWSTGNVIVIDAATNQITKRIQVDTTPVGLALTPDNKKLYVVNQTSSNVSVIDTATETVTKTISLGADKDPTLIHITPDGTRAFILDSFQNSDGHTEVSVIDTTNDTLTNTLSITNTWYSFDLGVFDRGFTKSGTNVTIYPDANTTLTFNSVSSGGDTKVTQLTNAPAAFSIKNNPVYLNISTTSTFTGTITVCIKYTDEAGENSFKFLHFEGGKWVDRTTSLDTTNNIICGSVTSFSNFIVAIVPTTQDLIDKINTMGLEKGLTNSLTAKLETAQRNNPNVAQNTLDAFINEVNAQSGKGLTPAQATELKDFAAILTQLL